jgi:cytoskeletal protein RodZ
MTTIPTSSSYYTLDFTSDAVTTTASPSASGSSDSDFPATTSDTDSTESATSESQPAETSVEQQGASDAISLTVSMAALGGIAFSWMLVAL